MKITFLATQSLESPGGGGRFLPLAKALGGLGHQVTILALHHDYPHLQEHALVRDGVRVRYVGQMHVRKSGNRKTYYGPAGLLVVAAVATMRLTQAALRVRTDVIHVCKPQPMNGIAAWVAHKLKGVPIYIDSDDYEAANNRFSGRWQQRVVAWCEDWLPSFAAGITANTTFIAERFRQLGYPAERIFLVPNGVDRERFAVLDQPGLGDRLRKLRQVLGIADRDRLAVYIGSMSTVSHAIDLLLDAFVQVLRAEPRALLLLVGGGEDLGKLQKRARDLQISSRARFLGRVPADQIPLYYRLGQVSVDPMRDSLAARSSLSLKLVESIAAGVPCVTADVGDRRDVVGQAGIAVRPDSVEELAGGILSVLGDEERAQRMRACAQEARWSHFWDRRVHDFASVYGPLEPDHGTA